MAFHGRLLGSLVQAFESVVRKDSPFVDPLSKKEVTWLNLG